MSGGVASLRPFLMFEGRAREAIDHYRSVFPQARLGFLKPHPQGEGVMLAELDIAGTRVLLSDSSVHHAFSFTPSVSLFVETDDAAALDRAFAALSDGGRVLMPLDDYGFSRRFGWTDDRFGVSWQLSLKLDP